MAAVAEDQPRQQNHNKLFLTMARHPELFCLLVAVILSVFSKYSRSAPKVLVQPQPYPRRFFTGSSQVVDYPYGNLGDVAELLQEEEILLVMYYAPWCARSKATRQEYDKVANYLLHQVTLVAINCWYPQGQCRQQNHFYSFPVIFFYHTTLDGHKYNGVLKAEHIISFVNRLLYPLVPIYSDEQLAFFIAKTDHSVVGFFDFHSSPQPPGFEQFYCASMRIIEKDPVQVVEFGLITNPTLAQEYMTNASQQLIFLTSARNQTLRYPSNRNFTSSSIVQWVLSLRSQYCVKLFSPAGSKSLLLGAELLKGPTLILFTPHYPLTVPNQNYNMMWEVALDYFDCKKQSRTSGMIDASIYRRWESLVQQVDLAESCRRQNQREVEEPRITVPLNTRSCCMSYIIDGPPTRYNACDVCVTYQPTSPLSAEQCRILTFSDIPDWTFTLPNPAHECLEIRDSYNPDQLWSMCCDQNKSSLLHSLHHKVHSHYRKTQSISTTHPDPYISDTMQNHLARKCRKLKLRKQYNWIQNQHIPSLGLNSGDVVPSIKGQACLTNRTLNVLVIDSRENLALARQLGLRLDNTPPRSSAAVIIDQMNEVQHYLKEPVTKVSLATFISNFTLGRLERNLRSLHYVQSDTEAGEVTVHTIHELTTDNFEEFVMQEDKDVLVLHYATWCGFCRQLAMTYLTLARYFQTTSAILFARINSDIHDLPWKYTVEIYPTLQFYPAYRKTESVSYPEHVPRTLPYLLEFVMTYGTHLLKLQTGLSICGRSCIQKNMGHAAAKVQDLRTKLRWLQDRCIQVEKLLNHDSEFQKHEYYNVNMLMESDQTPINSRLSLLHHYHRGLQKRLKLTQLQLGNARKLYRTLLESKGEFIEQHKLLQILQKHQVTQASINHQHQQPEDEEGDWSDVYSHMHDEL